MTRRHLRREEGRDGRLRPRRGRERLLEAQTAGGEAVEAGRGIAVCAVTPEVLRAERVDDDQKDVRPGGPSGTGGLRGHLTPGAGRERGGREGAGRVAP